MLLVESETNLSTLEDPGTLEYFHRQLLGERKITINFETNFSLSKVPSSWTLFQFSYIWKEETKGNCVVGGRRTNSFGRYFRVLEYEHSFIINYINIFKVR